MPTPSTTYAASLEDVRRAAAAIRPHAHRTPVLTCATIDQHVGRPLFFKCEMFQKVGAFKFRGACNAIINLADEDAQRGVVTHSSGNHAQALALAARMRGIASHIVMPSNTPRIKLEAVKGYGGNVYICEPNLVAREAMAREVLESTGGTMIPPYDHPDIIAGQGTAALELLEDVPDLDAIIAPIGGGGLMAGTCIAATGIKPGVRIFGAEPAGADDAAKSMVAGELIPQTNPQTVCDGLRTSLGQSTWPIIRDHVEQIITVEDDYTLAYMRLMMERMKIMVEPSSAVALAVAASDAFKALDGIERIGVILTGGNVDLDQLPWQS